MAGTGLGAALAAGLGLLAACGSTRGSTTGGATTGGLLAAGSPCGADQACASGLCGGDLAGGDHAGGAGNCCAAACSGLGTSCGAAACDDAGACAYPASGTSCGPTSCSRSVLVQSACDGLGACAAAPTPCPGHFACDDAGAACRAACSSARDCAAGFACNAGACAPVAQVGPCTSDEDCGSGICGVGQDGGAAIGRHCCAAACTQLTPPCGATDCLADSGICNYPGSATACGSVLASCANSVQQDPSVCDGDGGCPTPGERACDPFICGATACLTSCTDDSSCQQGLNYFCDTTTSTCCDDAREFLTVDSVNGSDSTPCCGGRAGPCQTLSHALVVSYLSGGGAVITASVADAGGDWAPAGEVYPILLSCGDQISAPGIHFFDPSGGHAAIFDVGADAGACFGGNTAIYGSPGDPVWIGMDSQGHQSSDDSSILAQASLVLGNAVVNGSAAHKTTAITVAAGAFLGFGLADAINSQGPVIIGMADGGPAAAGWNGIVCGAGSGPGLGCQVQDSAFVPDGLVIQGQANQDLDIEDFGTVYLASSPVIGSPPITPGFQECRTKIDASASNGAAVLLHGNASLTFDDGAVQCIAGDGFQLLASPSGTPTLDLTSSTIQNTERAIYASAGTATVIASTIQYNYNGIEQAGDGTHVGVIDLSGDQTTVLLNTLVCSSLTESVVDAGSKAPGICALNATDTALDATNTVWDTAQPDLFSCSPALIDCACEAPSCSALAGADGMDAVYEYSHIVTTTGNQLWPAGCFVP